MRDIVQNYPAGSASISCRIALAWSRYGAFGGSQRSLREMAVEIGNRLPGLTAPLAAAGVEDLAHAMRAETGPRT